MRVDVNPSTEKVAVTDSQANRYSEPLGTDPYAATRDAVFRCAVEIGSRMV